MNKAKLVKLGEEVLTEIDLEMEPLVRKKLEKTLCMKLTSVFYGAANYLEFSEKKYPKPPIQGEDQKLENYKSVRPILEDVIDNALKQIAKKGEER